jgi:RNA 3'-terminal phosphate cyclase
MTLIVIDGALGEGGGQVLRTSLALAVSKISRGVTLVRVG